jgi:hypothetical protein
MLSAVLKDAVRSPTGEDAASKLFLIRPDATGIVHVVGSGFWTPHDIDRHFSELDAVVRSIRQCGRKVRVAVDLRRTPAQLPETIARIGAGAERIYAEGDRVAIIVDSSLAKLQMRRVVSDAQHEMFQSPNAAMTWLCAFT